MPNVILIVSKPLDVEGHRKEIIDVVEYPIDLWSEQDPLNVLSSDIERYLSEYDGLDLDFVFKFRSISSEQRSGVSR